MNPRASLRGLASLVASALAASALAACSRAEPARTAPEPDHWSDAALLAEGTRYLDDESFRRTALEASLTNPANSYSRQRLTSYGLRSRGWDALPEWNPKSIVLTPALADVIRSGTRPTISPETPPIWDGKRPTTLAAWALLGREVFFRYPLRKEVYVEWAVAHPETGERLGVRPAADGTYPGLVAFIDTRGESQIGMTCGVCHVDVLNGGEIVVGQARRAFDYGALRLAYHAATKTAVEPGLAHRMRTWGPGRADVTEDDDEDPVAVPDLWGLKSQSFLTQAGTIKHTGAAALAIRQETQLLTSNHQTIRPPRELSFALAVFLYSLVPPPAAAATDPALAAQGKAIFAQQCARCHSNAAFGGDLVTAARVDTDPALANGAARGTGQYRTPVLIRVANAAPYFHQGAVATLEDVLSPARLEPAFKDGFLGPGPVAGHTYGTELPISDRAALVAYLRTL